MAEEIQTQDRSVKMFLNPEFAGADFPMIFSSDEQTLNLAGFVLNGSKFGHATLVVSECFCKIRMSWKFEERCTAARVFWC